MTQLNPLVTLDPGRAFAQMKAMRIQNDAGQARNRLLDQSLGHNQDRLDMAKEQFQINKQDNAEGRTDRESARQLQQQRRELSALASMYGTLESVSPEIRQQVYTANLQLFEEQGLDVSDMPEQLNDDMLNKLKAARGMAINSGIIKPSQGKYSKALQTAEDDKGNLVFVQGSELGGVQPVQGYKPVDPVQRKVDERNAIDTQTDRGQAELAKIEAESAAKSGDRDAARAEMESAAGNFTEIINNPAFEDAVGPGSGLTGPVKAALGTESGVLYRRVERAANRLVLDAAAAMKGALSDNDVRFLKSTQPSASDSAEVWQDWYNSEFLPLIQQKYKAKFGEDLPIGGLSQSAQGAVSERQPAKRLRYNPETGLLE